MINGSDTIRELRTPHRVIDRYALYDEIAAGGMATVHLGRLIGPVGFARTVAVKSLHPGYAKDPEFVSMFLDEARLAARVRHPNVVSTIDVVVREGELFLVMEYVAGESLAKLVRFAAARGERIPLSIAGTIVAATLHGLHAAHEALSDRGEPLGLVHRDVSPQNVLVGVDGVARVIDFGVAKAQGRVQTTREGQVKGKIGYMAPEQLLGDATRLSDVYAVGLILWELIAGRRAFEGDSEAALMARVLHATLTPPSDFVPELTRLSVDEQDAIRALDAVVMRAVDRDPTRRFSSAEEMALALQEVVAPVPARDVGAWVAKVGSDALADRLRTVAEVESASAMVAVDRIVASDHPRRPSAPSYPSIDEGGRAPGSPSLHTGVGISRELARDIETPRPRPRGLRWLVGISVALVALVALVGAFTAGTSTRAGDRARSSEAATSVATSAPPAETTSAPAPPHTVSSLAGSAPSATSLEARVPAALEAPDAAATPAPASSPPAAHSAHKTVSPPAPAPAQTAKPPVKNPAFL